MSKRDPYNDEITRPERILFIASGVATPAWIAISLTFWPGALLEGILVGVIFTVFFLGIGFVVVMGRYWAPKAVFTNEVIELTNPEIIHLEAPSFVMPDGAEGTSAPVSEEMKKKLDSLAKNIQPGQNEFGQVVPWGAMRQGGWRIGKGEKWEMEGKDGILLLVGVYPCVEGFENRIFVADRMLIRHEEVDPDILQQLKRATKGWFIPFDPAFKLYVLTGTDPAWYRFFRESPEVKAAVLDKLGIYGLARELAASVRRNGVRVATDGDEASFSELAEALKAYLAKKGVGIEPETYGPATAASIWSLFRGAQAMVSRQSVELDIAHGQITELRSALRGQDRRDAMLYSGGQSTTTPAREVRGSLDNIQGSRSRD